MALFKGETTSWQDIQIRLGNYAERDPASPSQEERSQISMDKAENIAKQDFVDNLFSDIGTSSADDEMAAIRRERIRQMMNQSSQSTVRRICKDTYQDEVTEGSKSAMIVVMMDRKGGDSFMESACQRTAKEWVSEIAPAKGFDGMPTRFYVGDIDDLIGSNFPASFLPFAVVYSRGKCQFQLQRATGESILNALKTTAKSLKHLDSEGVDEGDRRIDDDIRREINLRKYANNSGSEDESDDERTRQSGKGYASLDFERNVLRYR